MFLLLLFHEIGGDFDNGLAVRMTRDGQWRGSLRLCCSSRQAKIGSVRGNLHVRSWQGNHYVLLVQDKRNRHGLLTSHVQ